MLLLCVCFCLLEPLIRASISLVLLEVSLQIYCVHSWSEGLLWSQWHNAKKPQNDKHDKVTMESGTKGFRNWVLCNYDVSNVYPRKGCQYDIYQIVFGVSEHMPKWLHNK